jgi:transposase
MEDYLMSREDAAERMGVFLSHVDSMIESGELSSKTIGGEVFVSAFDVERNPMARDIVPSLEHIEEMVGKITGR